MPGFSFLSRSDREQIDQTAEMSGETKRDVEQMVPGGFADFPAKLTAYDSSSGYYSWTRRAFDSNRARYDHPATVQVGTPTSNPARFPNGDVVDVTTPVDVWLRPVGVRTTVGMVHEVIAGPPATASSGLVFVTSDSANFVCLAGSGGAVNVFYTLPAGEYLISIVGTILYVDFGDVTGQVTITPAGNPPNNAYVFCRYVQTSLGVFNQGFASGSFSMRQTLTTSTVVTGTMTAIRSTFSFGATYTINVQWSIWQYA